VLLIKHKEAHKLYACDVCNKTFGRHGMGNGNNTLVIWLASVISFAYSKNNVNLFCNITGHLVEHQKVHGDAQYRCTNSTCEFSAHWKGKLILYLIAHFYKTYQKSAKIAELEWIWIVKGVRIIFINSIHSSITKYSCIILLLLYCIFTWNDCYRSPDSSCKGSPRPWKELFLFTLRRTIFSIW